MIAPAAPAVGPTDYDIDSAASLQVVVNKHRPLNPATYVPARLVRVQGERLRTEAADAYKQLAKAAKVGRREHHSGQRLPFVQPAGQPL